MSRRQSLKADQDKISDEPRERPPSDASRSQRRGSVGSTSRTRSHSTDQEKKSNEPRERPPSDASRSQRRGSMGNTSRTRSDQDKKSDEPRERPPSDASRSQRRGSIGNTSRTRSNSIDQKKERQGTKPNLDNNKHSIPKNKTTNLRKDKRSKQFSNYVGMFKAKILVIGPRECGKTVISNFLADATEISGGDYHPTQGVRILEFESSGITISDKEVSCEVELWDCSGDQKFENCWPAIQKDVNGVLFVYNPDQINHGKALETLYVYFVEQQGLRDSQCMLFAHHRPGANEKTRLQTPSHLSKIPCVQTNLEDDADMVKQKFNDLLAILLRNWTERRDQEELSIMNH